MLDIYQLIHMVENVPVSHLLIALAISLAAFILCFIVGAKFCRNKVVLNSCSAGLILSGLAICLFNVWLLVSIFSLLSICIFFAVLIIGAAIYPYINDFVQNKKQSKVAG